MKIRTWLLISYLLMMILPLVGAYFLFQTITTYYDEKKVEEYYEVQDELHATNKVLRDPTLYEGNLDEDKLDTISDEIVQIKLYRYDGINIYATIREPFTLPNIESLYKDLYEIKENLNTFSYKEPVFDRGALVGLFEVKVYREQFMQTVKERTWLVFGIFVLLFLLIYILMAYFLHRKINKRLNRLMDEMSAFASGNFHRETVTENDEIGQLQEHFYRMRKQITRAQETIKEEQKEKEYMVAAISHDLKTPLTSIKAYAEALQQHEQLGCEDRRAYEETIVGKADFMKQMLDDLMTYTLLQSKDKPLEMVTVDGAELFDMLLSDYETLCKDKQINLTTKNTVINPLQVDVKEMIRVVNNLMSNAIQHTLANKHIHLLACEKLADISSYLFPFVLEEIVDDPKLMYLIVQNDGKGIEREKLPHLFDPLYQADVARSKKEAVGTGLGLSIAKKIIEMHGGKIAVYTETGMGVCFICTLPKYEGEIE